VIEGAVVHRKLAVTGEALHRAARKERVSRQAQEGTRGLPKRCEVADESVVVMNSRITLLDGDGIMRGRNLPERKRFLWLIKNGCWEIFWSS
jgi:hypothetical protein